MKKSLLILLFSLSLTSCYTFNHQVVRAFCVLESQDGKFCTIPSASSGFFYGYMEVNGEKTLVYCNNLSNGYPIIFWSDVSVQPFGEQEIDIHCFVNYKKCELFIDSRGNYYDDPTLDNWTQIAYVRDAKDSELDAKYYSWCSFKGLNDRLKLVFKPHRCGYINDDNYHNPDYVYLKDSSIFTFKLFGTYNDQHFVFKFLDEYKFSMTEVDDDEIKASGTYSSSRYGMTLHFEQNELLQISETDVTLDTYKDTTYNYEIQGVTDLSKYIEDDAIFLK